jgi:hypothetical protein
MARVVTLVAPMPANSRSTSIRPAWWASWDRRPLPVGDVSGTVERAAGGSIVDQAVEIGCPDDVSGRSELGDEGIRITEAALGVWNAPGVTGKSGE